MKVAARLLFSLMITSLFLVTYGYHHVVNKLKQYVESNATFALLLNQTFIEGNGTNITYTDMYQFFDEWITKPPNATNYNHNNFTHILSNFGQDTQTGSIIFSSGIAQQWFQEYMKNVKTFCDSPNSTYVIPGWEARSDINMTEYVIPPNGFQSFNDFFARQIKSEYRPIDSLNNNTIITSPCDGLIIEIHKNLTLNKNYTIKGFNYSLSTMLMNDYYAEQFIGGTIIEIMLTTGNYHRFHCSVSGNVAQIDQIGGFQYWTPDFPNTNSYYQWLANNCRRGILYVDTAKFGIVAHNYIGLWLVNSVNIHIDAGLHINKGDETGFFHYGGSAIALLFQKNALKQILIETNQKINVGQRIAIGNLQFYNEPASNDNNIQQQNNNNNNNNHARQQPQFVDASNLSDIE